MYFFAKPNIEIKPSSSIIPGFLFEKNGKALDVIEDSGKFECPEGDVGDGMWQGIAIFFLC